MPMNRYEKMKLFPDCAAVHCHRKAIENAKYPMAHFGLCTKCKWRVETFGHPTGGFIPSGALGKLATYLLKQVKPTEQEIQEALRAARGDRHLKGPWDQRPVYSYNLLMARPRYKPKKVRMSHILVGRRWEPSARAIVAAAIHYQLAHSVIGTRHQYNRWLVGCSYMARRSLMRPPGTTGSYNGKTVRHNYGLEVQDYRSIGSHILGIAHKLVGKPEHWSAEITSKYLSGIDEGIYHPPVPWLPYSRRGKAPGDHPFDFYLPYKVGGLQNPYGNKMRRATGLISGEWPEGLEVTWKQNMEAAKERRKAEAEAKRIKRIDVDPDWLFKQ